MKTLPEINKEIPITAEVDVLVVGGGPAGIGAAINTGEVKRGESVAVIGCGGVGLAAIAGAKLAGATTTIAVAIAPNKVQLARALGATTGVHSSPGWPRAAPRARTASAGDAPL